MEIKKFPAKAGGKKLKMLDLAVNLLVLTLLFGLFAPAVVGSDTEPPKTSVETLYEYTVGSHTMEEVEERWRSNDDRTWLLTGVMDGQIEKHYFGWSDTYKGKAFRTGLEKGTKLEITVGGLDIKAGEYSDIRLTLDYIYTSTDVAVLQLNTLRLYAEADNAEGGREVFGPFSIERMTPLGIYSRKSHIDYEYELVSERIALPEDCVIRSVIIKPFDYFPNTNAEAAGGDVLTEETARGIFKIGGMRICGYKNCFYEPEVEMRPFDRYEAVNNIIRRMYDLASVKWTPIEDIYGDYMGDRTVERLHLTAGETYYGLPYSQSNDTSLERFTSMLSDGLYVGTVEYPHISSLDCASAVFEAVSTYLPTPFPITGPSNYIWDEGLTFPLGWLNNSPGYDRDTNIVREMYSPQRIYEAYARLEKGDMLASYPVGQHARLISGNTFVSRDENGLIDPEKSYVIVTELRGRMLREYDQEIYEGVEWQPNPELTDLTCLDDMTGRGTFWRLNMKYTFADLYKGASNTQMYLPLRLVQLTRDTVEKPYFDIVNPNTIDDLKYGLKGTIVSNYKISEVRYTIENRTTGRTKIFEEYPERCYDRAIGMIHNMYSMYNRASEELQAYLMGLDYSDDIVFSITCSTGAEEKLALRIGSEIEDFVSDEDEPLPPEDEDEPLPPPEEEAEPLPPPEEEGGTSGGLLFLIGVIVAKILYEVCKRIWITGRKRREEEKNG